MKQIEYQLTLRQPVYARALGGDPNSGVSLGYIPGSLIRGVLLQKYAQANGKDNASLDAASLDMCRLFLSGKTCYLNAYPHYNGLRSLPIPHSWQQHKDNKRQVFDFSIQEPGFEEASNCRGVSTSFFGLENGTVVFVKPEMTLAVHNRRNREHGRPMEASNLQDQNEDPGMVFRYETLAAGQAFCGIILCDDGDANAIKSWLQGYVYLGGSRSASYGLSKFGTVSINSIGREIGGAFPQKLEDVAVFTLLSDTLIRDDSGQFAANADLLKTHICRRLGFDETRCQQVEVRRAFLRANIIGGFNRKWGLPLPQTIAISMGSIIELSGVACSGSMVDKLETQGVGERRSEGFGRITANWNPIPRVNDVQKNPVAPRVVGSSRKRPVIDDESRQLAKIIIARMFRLKMDELLINWTQQIYFPTGQNIRIRKAQISRLRNVIQNALFDQHLALHRVKTFLENARSRNSTRPQFENTFIENTTLATWLANHLDVGGTDAWKHLQTIGNGVSLPKIGDVMLEDAELAALGREYLLRYLDLVLAKLAKEVQS